MMEKSALEVKIIQKTASIAFDGDPVFWITVRGNGPKDMDFIIDEEFFNTLKVGKIMTLTLRVE